MPKFTIKKRGYNTKEVDEYISTLSLKYEERLSEQKDRVFELKNDVAKTNLKLSEYTEKDAEIAKALLHATQKASEIENLAKKHYEIEIKRLNLLYDKWQQLFKEIENKYPLAKSKENVETLIDLFKQSINEVLQQNFSLKTHQTSDCTNSANDNYFKTIFQGLGQAFLPKNNRENDIKDVIKNYNCEVERVGNLTKNYLYNVSFNNDDCLPHKPCFRKNNAYNNLNN